MKRKGIIIMSIVAVISVMLVLWSSAVSDVEIPKYEVIASYENDIEVRKYNPVIAAQVTTQGERGEAISAGFRLLADYIFGNTISQDQIAMTAPVMQQKPETIAMTAPVSGQQNADGWRVQFIMPSEYTMQTLPKPVNEAVKIIQVPAKSYAVIRFSGLNDDDNIAQHEQQLIAWLEANNRTALSPPAYAFYNPPWTLPFMRRNEVMIEIAP